MLNKIQIENFINESLNGTDKFLVECTVKSSNLIHIFIDSDSGVLIEDCKKLSRLIEKKLDRDENDFELIVSSAGLDQPFKMLRQYQKNIGKAIDVKLTNGQKQSGNLISVDSDKIVLQPFALKKKSKTPIQAVEIPFTEINETKIKIIFTSSE